MSIDSIFAEVLNNIKEAENCDPPEEFREKFLTFLNDDKARADELGVKLLELTQGYTRTSAIVALSGSLEAALISLCGGEYRKNPITKAFLTYLILDHLANLSRILRTLRSKE